MVSTKKRSSSFLKKIFVFQKICFKVKVWKTFETFTDCHIKTFRSLKRSTIWKSLVPFFRRTYALSVVFKMKTLRKSVFECSDVNQLKFCLKCYWKKQPFIFTVYLMNRVFQMSCTIMELKELHCINIWKASEAANFVFQWFFVLNSVKHKFFYVSIVKQTCSFKTNL